MQFRPYLIKLKLKSREIGRRMRRPIKTEPLDEFYKKRWNGAPPEEGYFAERKSPAFFFSPDNLDSYRTALREKFPESCRRITRRANNAVAHRFDILGSGEVFLGDKIDWHVDFKSGKRWGMAPFAKIQIVNYEDSSDIKIPWELSRLQFISDLGRGYILEGNSIHKREFISLLEDWERANPVDMGINWACSMEVAIRAINIIWGLHFFSFQHSERQILRRMIRLLYYHALHIERNLEIIAEGANSNHLVSDYLGIFYIGLLCPEFDRAKKWLEMGRTGLEATIDEQTRSDGANYEGSTSYHRLVLEMFLSAFILGRLNSISFSKTYRDCLHEMIVFSEAITPQSGIAPLMGDSDDGFIVRLSSGLPGDHRALVELGRLLFGERVPDRIPISEERLWYLGPDSLVPYNTQAAPKSRLFRESGYAVIRNEDFHLLFNASGIPERSFAGHKHNDILSFTLEIDSIPYLIDPGTYCYSADCSLRNLSRSTAIHNTVEIDGREQNRFFAHRLFYMMRDATPKIHLWTDLGKSVIVSASHNGYARLEHGVIHKRTITATPDAASILVTDEFEGEKGSGHEFFMRFVTPLLTVSKIDSSTIEISRNRFKSLSIRSSRTGLERLDITPAFYFPHYGQKAAANLIEFSYKADLPFKIESVIARPGKFAALAGRAKQATTDNRVPLEETEARR